MREITKLVPKVAKSTQSFLWFQCEECGKEFDRKDYLTRHVKYQHKVGTDWQTEITDRQIDFIDRQTDRKEYTTDRHTCIHFRQTDR